MPTDTVTFSQCTSQLTPITNINQGPTIRSSIGRSGAKLRCIHDSGLIDQSSGYLVSLAQPGSLACTAPLIPLLGRVYIHAGFGDAVVLIATFPSEHFSGLLQTAPRIVSLE